MKRAWVVFLVAPVLLVLQSQASFGATWSANKRLTFTAGSSAWPDIAVNGSNVYIVWHDDTSGGCEIYFKKSTNGGDTWQATKRLTYSVRDAITPALAVSGSSVYVVWAECDYSAHTDDVYFRKSTDGGANWQAVQRLTYSTDISLPELEPKMAVNGSNVYVVWFDGPSGGEEVYFKMSADGGGIWQAAKCLTNSNYFCREPSIAVKNSTVHIAWSGDDLYYKKSMNGGATWALTRWLAAEGASPQVAVDASGRVHVAYYAWPGGGMSELYYQRSPDAGATWTSPRRLTWTDGTTWYPDIAVDSSGNVFPVWSDNTPGNEEIYYRRSPDAGASWQAAQRLTFNGGNSIGPSVAANSSAVFVVWMDDTAGNYEIYFKRSIGGSI